MPLTDQARIVAQQSQPRILALWRALTALKTTLSFMNTGAHPDDETSAMLAAMRFRDGIDISYACSTRGEGGQNDIGTETAHALGTLRTAEMEAACDQLDLRMYWLSVRPDDPITDFGFSKSGEETLAKWGHDRTVARLVDILRTERPDIICPTFLDVPGQHGHHRAMTQAAHTAFDLAADPAFDGSTLPVWQVQKLYLPAWSGAGQAYDDDLPPPPATLTVAARGKDPVTGWSYAQIGQQSRRLHATQAMGRWVPTGDEPDFPLHLAQTRVTATDDALGAGLVQTLRDFGDAGLGTTQDACDAALAAFPDASAVLSHACEALRALQSAMPDADPQNAHKLTRKAQQLARVIHLAAGVEARFALEHDILHPGDQTKLQSDVSTDTGALTWTPNVPDGWSAQGDQVTLGPAAASSDPYPAIYLPGQPQAPCLETSLTVHGVTAALSVGFEVPPVIVPHRAATLAPLADVINIAQPRRHSAIRVTDISPQGAQPGLTVPAGWSVTHQGAELIVHAPEDVPPGLYTLPLTLDGDAAQSVQHIRRAHCAPRVLVEPATAQIRVIDVTLPDVSVGYIGGGNDRVALWLHRLGARVTDLSQADLSQDRLAECDTLVIGIFALKFCAGLADAMPRIHQWVQNGGTLVTLYHRPWDNWDADHSAPYRLEIGQPSLRWRVTDEAAKVTPLVPDHPVLTQPNTIGASDWDGWHKERGLYFAKAWDAAYTPLLAMNDAGEAPLHGALLAADVGRGRHIHTSLILHHQMEKLTEGAFRLMANLLAKRS